MITRPVRYATALVAALSLTLAGCGNEAEEAAEHYQRASTFHAKGDLRSTVIELKNALQLDPDHRDARWLLGRTYLTLGDGNAARKEIERASSLGLRDEAVDIALARAMLVQGELEESLAKIRSVPAAETDVEWRVLEGQVLLGLTRTEEARAAFTDALERAPGDARARRGLARLAMADGDTEGAEAQLDRALEAAEADADTWLLKGELELALGRHGPAESSFRKALETAPGNPVAELGLAQALLASGNIDEAARIVDGLYKRAPRDPRVNYLRALVARQRNDIDTAQEAAREVLAIAPNHLPTLLLMGQIHFLRREFAQSEDLLRRHIAGARNSLTAQKLLGAVLIEKKELDEALQILHTVERQTPNDPQLLAMLGTAYMAKRDTEKSRSYLDRASGMAPDASPIRTQLAVSHLASGDSDKAIAELEAVVESDPSFSRADVLLVLTHLRDRRFEEAVKAAEALAAKQPDSPEAQNFLGAALEGNGDRDGARAAYGKALEQRAGYSAAALNLARMDLQDGKAEDARLAYEKVLEREPNNEHALIAMAKIASDSGRAQESVALLEKARANNDRALRPRLILGSYYLRQGRREDALALAEEAAAIAPALPGVALLLGRAQLASGRAADAARTLEPVAERVPGSAQVHFQLAMAYGRLPGRVEETRAALERTLEIEPQNARAQLALGTLEVRTGEFDAAFARAKAIQAQSPESPAGHMLEGDVQMARRDPAAAVAAYERAGALGDSTTVALKINAARRLSGDVTGAEEGLDQWLQAHPQDDAVRLSRASRDQAEGRADRAVTDYEQIIERQPGNVIALNNLAWLYHARGDERALELARRAYEGASKRPEIIDTYGWLLVEDGQHERGIALLRRALRDAPDNGDIGYHLAAGLARAGDARQAREILEPFVASDASFAERAAATALLESLAPPN